MCMTYLQATKDPRECMYHSLNDLSVNLPWALVGLYADIIVVDVAPGHGDLEVVGPQGDGPTLPPKVGSPWSHECCQQMMYITVTAQPLVTTIMVY